MATSGSPALTPALHAVHRTINPTTHAYVSFHTHRRQWQRFLTRHTAGPDGNLWFTDPMQLHRDDQPGDSRHREYTLPTASANPMGITIGARRRPMVHGGRRGQVGHD